MNCDFRVRLSWHTDLQALHSRATDQCSQWTQYCTGALEPIRPIVHRQIKIFNLPVKLFEISSSYSKIYSRPECTELKPGIHRIARGVHDVKMVYGIIFHLPQSMKHLVNSFSQTTFKDIKHLRAENTLGFLMRVVHLIVYLTKSVFYILINPILFVERQNHDLEKIHINGHLGSYFKLVCYGGEIAYIAIHYADNRCFYYRAKPINYPDTFLACVEKSGSFFIHLVKVTDIPAGPSVLLSVKTLVSFIKIWRVWTKYNVKKL